VRLNGQLARRLESRHPTHALRVGHERLSGSHVIVTLVDDSGGRHGERLERQVREGTRTLVAKARRHGLRSVAVVPFGVNLGLTPQRAVDTIIEELLAQGTPRAIETVAICEIDADRYRIVRDHVLQRWGDLGVTEVEPYPRPQTDRPLYLHLETDGPKVAQFARAPGQGGTEEATSHDVSGVKAVMARVDRLRGDPPPFDEHEDLGLALERALLAESVRSVTKHPDHEARRWEILTDRECSGYPFELLSMDPRGPAERPACVHRVERSLLSGRGVLSEIPARSEQPSVLLLGEPTGSGDRMAAIAGALEAHDVRTTSLVGEAGLRDVVLDTLRQNHFDAVVFSGPVVVDWDSPARTAFELRSGSLWSLRSPEHVSVADIVTLEHDTPPTLWIVDVRGAKLDPVTPANLARWLLTTGTRSVAANRWRTSDAGIVTFTETTVVELFGGATVGDAVLRARQALHTERSPDWATFQLYGAGGSTL